MRILLQVQGLALLLPLQHLQGAAAALTELRTGVKLVTPQSSSALPAPLSHKPGFNADRQGALSGVKTCKSSIVWLFLRKQEILLFYQGQSTDRQVCVG